MRYVLVLVALWAFARDVAAESTAPENLLKAAPTAVHVSSTVANKSIPPDGLIDGDLSTAWNSKTGKLVGETIEIRVPASTWVNTIRMTVGFTKVDEKLGDLFVMNQRIKKVRVYRNGTLLKEQTFDIENRALQAIPIEQAGGDYKIELAELVAGTKKNWKEAAVSELDVLGRLSGDSDMEPSAFFSTYVQVGTFAASEVRTGTYDKARVPAVLVRVPTDALIAVAIGEGPRAFTSRGLAVELQRIPGLGKSSDFVVAAVRIVETETQKKAWIGRRLQLHGAAGPVCAGTVRDLAVYGHFSQPHGVAATAHDLVVGWDPRATSKNGPLVAIIEPDAGASCKDAVWATAPTVKVTRAPLDKKKYRDVLFGAFFSDQGDYKMMAESYLMEDLERGNVDESTVPKSQQLSEAAIKKTFSTVSACIGTSCIGAVFGTFMGPYKPHDGFDYVPIENGTAGNVRPGCGEVPDAALAAADINGDGAIDLVFSAPYPDQPMPSNTVVTHDGSCVSIGLREHSWHDPSN